MLNKLGSLIPHKFIARLPMVYYPFLPFMHEYKCLFVHIPKNAGSAVLSAFNYQGSRWHTTYIDFFRASPFYYNKYVKFAIVRNPFTRIRSAYQYAVSGGNGTSDDLALKFLIEANSSCINSFIFNVLTSELLAEQPVFKPQYLFVFDKQYHCKVDKLIRFEQLKVQWRTFATKHGFPLELPVENKSPKLENESGDLKLDALKKIHALYKRDFDLLGYSLEGHIN